jgi:hypothetical protein
VGDLGLELKVQSLRFQISDFGSGVSGIESGVWNWGFEDLGWGMEFGVSDFGFWVSGCRSRGQGVGCKV